MSVPMPAKPVLLSVSVVLVSLALAGCDGGANVFGKKPAPDDIVPEAEEPIRNATRPKARQAKIEQSVLAPVVPLQGQDPILAAEVKPAALKPSARPEQDLGVTVALLGETDQGGFWLKTPLVRNVVLGRIVYLKTGQSANVTLIPMVAASGDTSQISGAAMRVLAIELSDSPEFRVFVR